MKFTFFTVTFFSFLGFVWAEKPTYISYAEEYSDGRSIISIRAVNKSNKYITCKWIATARFMLTNGKKLDVTATIEKGEFYINPLDSKKLSFDFSDYLREDFLARSSQARLVKTEHPECSVREQIETGTATRCRRLIKIQRLRSIAAQRACLQSCVARSYMRCKTQTGQIAKQETLRFCNQPCFKKNSHCSMLDNAYLNVYQRTKIQQQCQAYTYRCQLCIDIRSRQTLRDVKYCRSSPTYCSLQCQTNRQLHIPNNCY
jgi:hypothetical protein